MQRREFLAASAAAALGLAAAGQSRAADQPATKQLLELRLYTFITADQQNAYIEFLGKTQIPALNRLGINPVGVFKMLKADNPKTLTEDSLNLYVLLPYSSAEALVTLPARLAADEVYQKAGQAIIAGPKATPPYARFESTLMLAFDNCPKVEVPSKADTRLQQLRIYESHNGERALKKIQMFNQGGEIDIFRRNGMNPVFFGQSLVGSKLPNLTYMLAFDDQAAMDKAWAGFRNDPAWKKISTDAEYKDTVSTITNLILRPAPGSQI